MIFLVVLSFPGFWESRLLLIVFLKGFLWVLEGFLRILKAFLRILEGFLRIPKGFLRILWFLRNSKGF